MVAFYDTILYVSKFSDKKSNTNLGMLEILNQVILKIPFVSSLLQSGL